MNFFMQVVLFNFLVTNCSSLGYIRKLRSYESKEENGFCVHDLCDATEEYPDKEIEKLVANNTKFSSLFGNIVGPHMNMHNRFNMFSENMCQTRSIVMYPQRGKNIFEMWRTIVNIDGYRQSVEFQSCVTGSTCFGDHMLPYGYEAFCENQFIQIRLVVIDDNGNLKLEKFPIPSACACVYAST